SFLSAKEASVAPNPTSPYCPHCMVWRGHKATCPAKDSPVQENTDYSLENYRAFLRAKTVAASEVGYTPEIGEIHPWLKPHQKAVVQWAVRGGRRAIFASFGLGKTVMQLEILRLLVENEQKCRLANVAAATPSTSRTAESGDGITASPAGET